MRHIFDRSVARGLGGAILVGSIVGWRILLLGQKSFFPHRHPAEFISAPSQATPTATSVAKEFWMHLPVVWGPETATTVTEPPLLGPTWVPGFKRESQLLSTYPRQLADDFDSAAILDGWSLTGSYDEGDGELIVYTKGLRFVELHLRSAGNAWMLVIDHN